MLQNEGNQVAVGVEINHCVLPKIHRFLKRSFAYYSLIIPGNKASKTFRTMTAIPIPSKKTNHPTLYAGRACAHKD